MTTDQADSVVQQYSAAQGASIGYATQMGVWLGAAVVGVIVVGLTIRRLLARSAGSSDLNLGEVSQSWLIQKQADKSEH